MTAKKGLIFLSIIVGILLIPLIAMQFTTEVNWDAGDFVVAGLLLLVFVLLCDFAYRNVAGKSKKILMVFALLILFILIYMEMAVGIFGTPIAGN